MVTAGQATSAATAKIPLNVMCVPLCYFGGTLAAACAKERGAFQSGSAPFMSQCGDLALLGLLDRLFGSLLGLLDGLFRRLHHLGLLGLPFLLLDRGRGTGEQAHNRGFQFGGANRQLALLRHLLNSSSTLMPA